MNNKKFGLLLVMLGLVFTLTACGGSDTTTPIIVKDASFFQYILEIPIAWLMGTFGGWMNQSFPLAIIFTTIVIRTIAWPIYAKSNDLSLKMKLAQPDIQRLQMKYALKKDPASQQKMQLEMMEIYKKHKINMFGCLLPFLQMPLFIAMYRVVTRITVAGGTFTDSVSNHSFLGINLSSGQEIWNYVFAVVVGLTMYILQTISARKPKFMKNTGRQNLDEKTLQQEKTMKYISYFMIIMMVVASFTSKSLAFYWIVGNLYSIAQTLFGRFLQEKKYQKEQKEIIYKG